MRLVPMAILVAGISLAAVFGARNTTRLTEHRQAVWLEQRVAAAADDAEAIAALRQEGVIREGEAPAEALARLESSSPGLPQPGERLTAWLSASGIGWGAGVVLILVGAVLARRQQQAESTGGGASQHPSADFLAAVARVRTEIASIGQEIAELPMDDDAAEVRERLDTLAADVLMPVVDARGRLIARNGIGGFAEYFGPFSAGERNLARTWSALTDGHAVVAREALASADVAFAEAEAAYQRVQAR